MAGSQATLESYDRMEIMTAAGRLVTGKALSVPDAIKILRMLGEAETGGTAAQAALVEEFFRATELTNSPTIGEIVNEVLPHFLFSFGASSQRPTPTPSSSSAGTT